MALENVVIAYIADISEIKKAVTQISTINKQLAIKMGVDFSKGFKVISSELKKIQFNKQFKIKVEGEKGLKKVRGTISTLEKTVRSADGQLFKFTETIGKSSKGATTLASSISKVAVAQSKLSGASSQLGTNFKSLKNINSSFSKQLGSFGQVSKLVGTSLNQLSDSGSKVSKIFETTNGKFVKLTQTTKRLPNGIQTVTRSIQQLSKAQALNATVIERNNKPTRSFTQNLKSLAGRALLTIPVWFALRTAISSVFRTIRNGLRDIILFDRALQKLRRNLEASSTDIERDFTRVQSVITKFSLQTGKSVENITNAIQKFATVGFDLETSLVGGLQSTKLAITLFGDVEDTAQAFARSLRVMTEDLDTAEEKQTAISEALALTDQLWQTNAFEINEFSQNLTKFAGVATIANLSIEDTLTLLATLSTGGLANRAGRLLRSTLLKSLQDIEKVTRELDLDFDPKTQPTIEFILALVDSLKGLKVAENIPVELAGTLGELFTVRGTEVIAALVALEKTLKENIALTPDVKKFNDTFERILKTTGSLAEQFTNVNKEIGKAFVTGLTGGEDFNVFLQKLIPQLKELRQTAEEVGFVINGLGQSILGLVKIINTIANLTPFFDVKQILRLSKEIQDLDKRLIDIIDRTAKFGDVLQEGLSGNLEGRALKVLVVEVENRLEAQNGVNVSLTKALVLLKEQIIEQDKLVQQKEAEEETTKKITAGNKERKAIAELVLKTELDILRAEGATASQLAIVEEAGRKRLNIEKTVLDQLEDQLNKEKEINAEKRLRSEIGNESLKLFRIAQKEGIQEARIIGEVLAGQRDFDNFIRAGSKAVDIFKKEFADVFEQQQALRFFRGDLIPGQRGLRGGANIPIREEAIRGISTRTINLEQRRAENLLKRLEDSSKGTEKNTSELVNNTRSLQELTTLFKQGALLQDINAQNLLVSEISKQQNINRIVQNILPQRQILDITVDVDGSNLRFQGTPEAIRQLANQVSIQVAQAVEEKIVNDIETNNNSSVSQAIDGKIENF